MSLTRQPSHHFASGRRTFAGHEHLLVPAQMTLKRTETVDVFHALNELVIGFHDRFTAPCFFNTPMEENGIIG